MSNKIKIFPLTLLDKCIGTKIWIVMKGKREFAGTLRGFDDFFNMVLENVTEIWVEGEERKSRAAESMLLNGHDIAYVTIELWRWCLERTLSIRLWKSHWISRRRKREEGGRWCVWVIRMYAKSSIQIRPNALAVLKCFFRKVCLKTSISRMRFKSHEIT